MNVLVVGSSMIDLFLEVQDKTRIETLDDKLLLKLGDKIPVDIKKLTIGGNGANVSVGLKRLSSDITFYTFFGKDLFSREMEDILKKEGINLIAERVGEKSSLSLIFDLNKDRIVFSHHERRNHSFNPREVNTPNFIYLTSIGDNWQKAYEQVLEYAGNNNIPIGVNPGSRQLEEKTDIVIKVIRNSEIIFLNKEEAKRILGWLNINKEEAKDLLGEFKKLGPKIVSITDGDNGAYALDSNENYYWIRQFGEDGVDKTGAGDAYASGFLAKYLHGGEVPECMRWGPANAFSVAGKYGAQEGLLTLDQMNEILKEHEDFKAEKI